jgi:triosephosphate isomerase
MVRNFFIGGNWKMNGSVKQAKELVELLNSFEVPANTGKFFFLFNSSIEDSFIYSYI